MKAGGGGSVAGVPVCSQPLMWSCSESQAETVFAQSLLNQCQTMFVGHKEYPHCIYKTRHCKICTSMASDQLISVFSLCNISVRVSGNVL